MRNIAFAQAVTPYRLDFYNDLCDCMGFDVYYIFHSYADQLFSSDEQRTGCHHTPTYLKSVSIFGHKCKVGISRIIRKSNPCVVIVPEFSFITVRLLLIRLFSRNKFRIISQCDDSYEMVIGDGFTFAHKLARKICMPLLDDVILVDPKVVDWYKMRYGKGIWMPIIRDEKKYPDYDSMRKLSCRHREQYGLDGCLSILFVGRLTAVKNLPVLIKACAELDVPYKLIIVGDGPMRLELENLSMALGVNAIYTGAMTGDELLAFYFACDLFVLPSILEPFGAVTNEALLSGCPCCVSDHAGSSCLLDGTNGFTFDPESVPELVAAIKKASTLPRPENRRPLMPIQYSECLSKLADSLSIHRES